MLFTQASEINLKDVVDRAKDLYPKMSREEIAEMYEGLIEEIQELLKKGESFTLPYSLGVLSVRPDVENIPQIQYKGRIEPSHNIEIYVEL